MEITTDNLNFLPSAEIKARRDQVIDTLQTIQASFKALTLELLFRDIVELLANARYLDLSTNSNYENGTFWELDDVLDNNGVSLFSDDTDPLLAEVCDLFNLEYSADYTDFFGINEASYFDLTNQQPIEDIPAPLL